MYTITKILMYGLEISIGVLGAFVIYYGYTINLQTIGSLGPNLAGLGWGISSFAMTLMIVNYILFDMIGPEESPAA